jgi:hypothetical protein
LKVFIHRNIKDRRVLTDGDMTLELYLVRGNLHSEGMLMAYVPKEKLLIQADTFIPRPRRAALSGAKPLHDQSRGKRRAIETGRAARRPYPRRRKFLG